MTQLVEIVCPSCHGSRGNEAMGQELCGDCAGTGRDTRSDLWAEACRGCGGSCTRYYCRWVACSECNGAGTIIITR